MQYYTRKDTGTSMCVFDRADRTGIHQACADIASDEALLENLCDYDRAMILSMLQGMLTVEEARNPYWHITGKQWTFLKDILRKCHPDFERITTIRHDPVEQRLPNNICGAGKMSLRDAFSQRRWCNHNQ